MLALLMMISHYRSKLSGVRVGRTSEATGTVCGRLERAIESGKPNFIMLVATTATPPGSRSRTLWWRRGIHCILLYSGGTTIALRDDQKLF